MKPIFTFFTRSLLIASCTSKSQSTGTETRTDNGQSLLFVDMDQCRDTIGFGTS